LRWREYGLLDGIRKTAVGYGGGEGRLKVKMTRREKEHYEIARRFDRPFTLFEFKSLYRKEYPDRASEPIPTDFCVNLDHKRAAHFPKFLRWLGRGRYEFINPTVRS
jgi:hypothetical protein